MSTSQSIPLPAPSLPIPPRPLPRTPRLPRPAVPILPPHSRDLPPPLLPLLLGVEHEAEDVEGELRELEAHGAEAALGLVAEDVAALAPEAGDGLPDRGVVAARVPVDVAGVRELGDGGRGHEVDLGVRERLERGQGELLGQGVDLGVLEELAARLVQGRGGGVRFEGAGRELVREVLARVEVFEEARGRFEVVVLEVDGAVLFV